MRMMDSTDEEEALADAVIKALGDDMAAAIDEPSRVFSGVKPTAEFVRHREVRGKMRRIRITVTLENA